MMTDHSKTSFTLSGKRLELLASLLAEEGIGQETLQVIPRRKNLQEFPLSFNQQRLWLLDRLENGIHYNDHFDLRLTGRLDVAGLEWTLQEILRRHEVMRSVLSEVEGVPFQTIAPPLRLALPRVALTGIPESRRMVEATRLAIEEARRPFNLSLGPVWRFALVEIAKNDHLLLITAHHIAIDGWSRSVFLRELSALYPAFLAGRPSPLKEPPMQFADYAAWQAEWAQSETAAIQFDYWKRELAGASVFLPLPTDRPRPMVQSFRGTRHWFTLSPATTACLKDLCQRERVSLFMALLAVVQTLLHRYTGQDDILVWTPVANRMRKELEDMIGYFLNMLVLRGRLSGDPSFRELLRHTRETTLGALAHQDLPLEKLIDVLQPERTQSNPLFQVLFVLQNVSMPNVEMSGLHVRAFEIDSGTANFDLTISLAETPEGLTGRIEYATDLFDAERIERMAGHFQMLIEDVCQDPGRRLSQLSLLTAGERNQLLVEWNGVEADPSDSCIHQMFERQAQSTPDRIAIRFQDEQWSYARLDARSRRIAEWLRSHGVEPGALVGVCMEPSPQLVANLLGILRCGAAYLPMDPTDPPERLAFILEDAQTKTIITETTLSEKLRGLVRVFHAAGFPSIVRSDEIADNSDAMQMSACDAGRSGDLACVIYTSGADGRPNGVQIEHRSLANLVQSIRREPGLCAEDVFVTTATPLDRAIFGWFLPLTTGAGVAMANGETLLDGQRLARLLERSGATMIDSTPVTLRRLIQSNWKGHAKLKILCGGEPWHADLAEQLLPRCGSLWNMYGATETTIWSAASRVTAEGALLSRRPIANAHLRILDKSHQPVPIGLSGEVFIGGRGVARGYLNRPELNSEKFVSDAFCGEPGARVYRTGDLARYYSDGRIEFLGRTDQQIQLNGFRIQPGEIESVLAEHPSIRQAVVTMREDVPGDRRLVGYLIAAPEAPSAAALRDWLRSKLPEYMLPAEFITLGSLPLTANGTVNRNALPAPSQIRLGTTSSPAAPRDMLEQHLVKIWENMLRIRPVSVDDNFFELGGHSLTAVRLFSEIRKQTGRNLPLATLFQAPTVKQLAENLRKEGWAPHWSSLVPIQPGGAKPTFFCVHGGGGNVLLFRDLAKRLGSNYPFYALQSQGLDGTGNCLMTVNEMAVHYLKEIRQLQPDGPYYLGGFCMGGAVAYHMAQLLLEQGQETKLLVFFDTYNHNGAVPTASLAMKVKSLGQKAYFHWANVAQLRLRERMAYLREKIKQARKREWERLSIKLAGVSKRLGLSKNSARPHVFLENINDQVGFSYQPTPYPRKITMFQPQTNYHFLCKPYMGWSEFGLGGFEVIELPVYPGGMFVEPYVRLLADKLRACIDAAEKTEKVALDV